MHFVNFLLKNNKKMQKKRNKNLFSPLNWILFLFCKSPYFVTGFEVVYLSALSFFAGNIIAPQKKKNNIFEDVQSCLTITFIHSCLLNLTANNPPAATADLSLESMGANDKAPLQVFFFGGFVWVPPACAADYVVSAVISASGLRAEELLPEAPQLCGMVSGKEGRKERGLKQQRPL